MEKSLEITEITQPDLAGIIVCLQSEKAELQSQNTILNSELEVLRHNLAIFQRALFGRSSEKVTAEELEQFALMFNEAEVGSAPEQVDLPLEESQAVARKKTGRKPLPKDLPRIQKIYDLAEADKLCKCGCTLSKIGDEVSEQLDYCPARLQVIEHIRYKYACKGCEDTVKCAPVPIKPIAKANATAGLLANILVSKFEDHLPLYRQSQMWARLGIDIPRATLCNWVLACGNLFNPLIALLKKDIVSQDYVCSDETTVQVLKSTTDTSYMWVHMSGNRTKRGIVYDYQSSRSGIHATEFLKGFQGYHQCDGYSGYNAFHASTGLTHIGCLAHARRKFYDIIKITKTAGIAHQMIKLIGELYKIEAEAEKQGLDPGQIYELRQKKAVPILDKIKQLLDLNKDKVPPKSPIGKAIAYMLNQWQSLNAYLMDGRIRIDNNDCERIIKPFAVGRKNWLFCVSTKGAQASANIYSIIQTCKANKINTYDYITYVLQNILTVKTEEEMRALLPYNIDKKLFA